MTRVSVAWLLMAAFMFVLSPATGLPAEKPKAKSTPEIISVYPLGATSGAVSEIEIRGSNLEGAYAVWSGSEGIQGRIKKIEQITLLKLQANAQILAQKEETLGHRVLVDLEIDSSAKLGRHSLRLVSPRGLSNAHPFLVTVDPVVLESQTPHNDPPNPQLLKTPALLGGKLWEKGEADYYSFDALPGEEIEFHAVSNTAANSGKFDAIQLTLYEPGGTWFDPKRPTRLAFAEEARLTYTFSQGGRYLLRVGTYAGISGPDIVYLLRIAPVRIAPVRIAPVRIAPARHSTASSQAADLPELHETLIDLLRKPFVRRLEPNRIEELHGRSVAMPQPEKGAAPSASSEANGASELFEPVFLEGAIDRPGKVDSYNLKLKAGQRLAFELETPDATLPQFNPRLELVDASGQDICNNFWRRVGGDNNYWVKLPQAKTIYTFERDGEYVLRIRELISRYGNPSFKYRILIRPQIPHVGKIKVEVKEGSLVAQDSYINLAPGEARKLSVTVEHQEGFSGDVALSLENLPPGVQALTGAEEPPIREAELDLGKKEQFVPKTQKIVILVMGSPDAAATPLPQVARLVARPVVEGQVGAPLLVQEIPLMVLKPVLKPDSSTELARKGL